jgi:hypothetical protein
MTMTRALLHFMSAHKSRPPTAEEAKAWLLKMAAYPKYQRECLRFWHNEYGLDYSYLIEG